ncbi:MAG: hypothetical protein CR982_01710 [Candidatus Cloacimonadota bacterium]|nr:MAG: hypothetical protein CR982_01710 [Candidatus Cloacimonadota bacterium]PIE79030.1 MAG: hypothetical protein CSA15_04870 [Candidatus Delongbacteria bacterium]
MKIIISPSKTRYFNNSSNLKKTTPLFNDKAESLSNIIKGFEKTQLAKIMKIKGEILDRTYEEYKEFSQAKSYPAIESYTGTVYKEIKFNDYNDDQLIYLENNLKIMSALYGVVSPFDGIKPYRLDMNMKIMEQSLYKFWADYIGRESFTEKVDELIIDLASSEFSKMLKFDKISIDFKQFVDGKYKSVAVYSKMARGKMTNYLIENMVENIDDIKKFDLDGYSFNEELSSERKFIFSR